jgi:divalent metal cation (Fe/Co/Zn/Cd) transporter
LAAVFEGSSLRISYSELRRRKDPEESVFDEIIGSKDPTIFTVFLEDSAGLVGTILAFCGIFLGHILHNAYLDPVASILIGFLLASVAALLGRETGALLVGERTNRAKIRRIRRVISQDSAVERIGELLTMQLGPQHALLTVEIRFQRGLKVQELEAAIDRIKQHIRELEPTVEHIFIEPGSLTGPAMTSRAA